MLKRLKYVSKAVRPMTIADIDLLAEQAVNHNMDRGITGILMYSGGIFFQEIEGLKPHIDELFEMISSDPRHTNILILGAEEGVPERLFPDWAMEKINFDERADDRLEPLKLMLEAIFSLQDDDRYQDLVQRLVGGLERAIWAELVSDSE